VLEDGRGLDLDHEPLGPSTAASSGLRTLSATLRACFRSSARYTVAMPPAPSSRSMWWRSDRAAVRRAMGAAMGRT
jgi:hypothetical protein